MAIDTGNMTEKLWRDSVVAAIHGGRNDPEDFADRAVLSYKARFGPQKAPCMLLSTVMEFTSPIGLKAYVLIGDAYMEGVVAAIHSPNGDARQPNWVATLEFEEGELKGETLLVNMKEVTVFVTL